MNEHRPAPDVELARRLGLEEERARPRWVRVALAGALVLALLLGAGLYFLRPGGASYVTAEAARGDMAVTVSATGTIQPQDQVDVGAEISGRVDSVSVDFNDHVTQGQVLALINTDQIRAQLAQARAALAAARASVATMQATTTETKLRRDRADALYARGGVSAQEQQNATADYERAVAGVAKAKADVENATAQTAIYETMLSKAAIRSPIDGVVLNRKVEPGQTVAAQFQTPVLFTLASDLSRMELQVDIDEADIGVVHEGQAATFTVDAYPQRRFDAKLVSLRNAPKTVNGVVTYQGVLDVDNSGGLLRPGLTATVDMLVAEVKDALLVPNGALRFTPAGVSPPALPARGNGEIAGRVWVLQNGTPAPRDLKIGRTDGTRTEILSGDLRQGETVVTDMNAGGLARR
jgi:HlyD family secretion protein